MERAVDGAIRLGRAWKALNRERRVAAGAAIVLWLTLFLPWYQASVVNRSFRTRGAAPVSDTISGWASFGLIQALILILSVGILGYLFLRAEGRAGELPGGDGWAVTGAGGLCAFLVLLGLFSAPSPATHGGYVLSTGLEWGIFLALVSAATLTWAGNRIRSSLEDDPFLAENRRSGASNPPPGDEPPDGAPAPGKPPAPVRAPAPERPGDPPEEPTRVADSGEEPTRTAGSGEAPTRAAGAAAEPLTAAAAARADSEAAADDAPEETPGQPRSSWRPAERPNWTDPERPMGWLTAPPEDRPPEDDDQ
jgi:hypothetical protein